MEENVCKNCFFGKKIFGMNDCMCKFNGIVSNNSICNKYQQNLFEKRPPKKRDLKQYDEGQFNINDIPKENK